MKGIKVAGKAYVAYAQLQALANAYKGKTVAEYLELRTQDLKGIVARQAQEIAKSFK